MKRKVVMLAFMLALVPFLVFGGGSNEAAPAPVQSEGPVQIEFWTSQTQSDRLAIIQVLVDTYTALNPDVIVKVVPVDENDLPTQLNAAAAISALPAIVELGSENAVAFGAEGYLDTAAAKAVLNEIGVDKFYQGVLNLLKSSAGEYYALPYHGWIQGLWYREDWFKEAGLNPPSTWADILKAAQYFHKPEKNQYGILVGTRAEVYAEQCFTPIAMSNNAFLFDKTGKLIFNSPAMKEAVRFYAELAKFNPPGPQNWRARDYYIQGRMAMFFYSTYIMDDLAIAGAAADSLTGTNFSDLSGTGFDPDLVKKTKMVPIINNKNAAGYGVVVGMGIGKQKDPRVTQAAQHFLRYLYTPNTYITYLHMAPGGMNPSLREIATNARFQNDPQSLFKNYGPAKMAEIIEGMDKIQTFSIVDGYRVPAASKIFAKQVIPQMLYSVTQENVSVDAAMAKAEAEMIKIIEE